MADVSISDLVQRVRDLLSDAPYTTTSTTINTGTTVAVPDGTIWTAGDIGEWQTGTVGYEQFLVTDVVANNLTVSRGYNGTTAEAHTSGDRVVQNPSFTGRQIQQALTAAVKGLWPSVYNTNSVTVVPDTTSTWYNLHADTLGIVRVYQTYSTYNLGRFGARGQKPFEVDFLVPTSICASGKGIRFPTGTYDPTNNIFVIDMRAVTGTSDIKDSQSLPVADCVVYGAAGRIVQALEIPRVAVGADLETSGTVGTGSRLQTGAYYSNLAKQKLEELALKHEQLYQPVRLRRL